MALSRRNVLIALGAVVGGGGALVGTGAFTTVSAERSVEVSTAGDASAFLTITSDSEYVPDAGGGDTLTIDLSAENAAGASGFNDNAITTITDVVEVTNNAPDDAEDSSTTVGLSAASPGDVDVDNLDGEVTLTLNDDSSNGFGYFDVTIYLDTDDGDDDLSSNTPTLSVGNSAYLDVEVDTTVDYSDPDTDDTLTIVAS